MTSGHRVVLASVLLAGAAALVQAVPAAGSALELSRPALASGDAYRLITGHLAHWSWEHWFWDAIPLVIMTAVAARRAPARTALCLAVSALLVPLAVLAACPGITCYRGLSGIDAALYVFCGFTLIAETRVAWRRRALGLALAGFAAKCVYEALTGGAVFIDARAASIVTVPVAHLTGGLVGWALSRRHPRSR